MYMYVYLSIHPCIYLCTMYYLAYGRIYICIYICVYIYTYMCMYIYVFMYLFISMRYQPPRNHYVGNWTAQGFLVPGSSTVPGPFSGSCDSSMLSWLCSSMVSAVVGSSRLFGLWPFLFQ